MTVIQPQCKSKGTDENNPNETYNPWVNELAQGNSCSQTAKGEAITKEGFGSSPLQLVQQDTSFRGEVEKRLTMKNVPEDKR